MRVFISGSEVCERLEISAFYLRDQWHTLRGR